MLGSSKEAPKPAWKALLIAFSWSGLNGSNGSSGSTDVWIVGTSKELLKLAWKALLDAFG